MVRRPRERPAFGSAGLVILFGLLGATAAAQVTTTVSPRALAVGERTTYVIAIDHEAPEDVQIDAPVFPGLRLVGGPSIRPVPILSGGDRSVMVEVQYTFEAVAAGRFVLPAHGFMVAGQLYETEPRLLSIGTARNRNLVPFLARWTGPDGPLVVGQSVAYAIEIYNADEYLYPQSVTFALPENAILEEISGLGAIEQQVVDGVALYAIPAAVFMVTASSAGTLRLPAVTIAGGGTEVQAPARSLVVQPLPEPVERTGAVGSFSVSTSLHPSALSSNERALLTIRVAGTGNLHFLAMPEVRLSGFSVESDETETRLEAVEAGYTGHRERHLTLRPRDTGPYRIEIAPYAYLDPTSGSVRTLAPRSPAVTVTTVRLPPDDPSSGVALRLLTADELGAMERAVWYRSVGSYGWLAPGLLFLLITRFWKRRHTAAVVLVVSAAFFLVDAAGARLPWREIDQGLRRNEEGDVNLALYAFERAGRLAPESPGIHHNLAVLHYQLGDVPRAVYAAREAVRLAPGSSRLRRTLAGIESGSGLDRSIPPPHRVHPDLYFALLATAVNLLFVLLAIAAPAGRRRGVGGAAAIGLILLFLGAAGSAAALTVSAGRHADQLGVVRSDTMLLRIPEAGSAGWLFVSRGTAVEVVAVQGDHVLVRNVLGLEGWVPLLELLWPGNPAVETLRYRGCVL